MKTIINIPALILSALFLFLTGTKMATAEGLSRDLNRESEIITIGILAPVTPSEAYFEEVSAAFDYSSLVGLLAPEMPASASFEDFPDKTPMFNDLAPVIPQAASFEEIPSTIDIDNQLLAPVTPRFAEF